MRNLLILLIMLIPICTFAESKTYQNEYEAILDLLKGIEMPEFKEDSFNACIYITEHVSSKQKRDIGGVPEMVMPSKDGWIFMNGKLYHLSNDQRQIMNNKINELDPANSKNFLVKHISFMKYKSSWLSTYIVITHGIGPLSSGADLFILKKDKNKKLFLKHVKTLWKS